MTWDLRSRYAFDATEGQIPEGNVSPYGPANSHANCVPASFTAALGLAGFPDIDPQRITNEVFGPNYRGGFGNFSPALAWIKANVAGAPSFTDGPFNFATADAAGQAGQLVIVAGWIDPATVTFTPAGSGFSHASILAAHLANDTFVIWNTWFGQVQTYSRATLAASLYEMAVMTTTGGTMTPTQETQLIADVAGIHAFLSGQYKTLDAELTADIKLIPPPGPIHGDDVAAIAAAVVAALPTPTAQTKPPAPPQAVWDWLSAIRKWLGW